MAQIPFKVSARTARLIGRENIATSKGAIIELVKNGYDADSKVSIVFFDNKYSTVATELSIENYNDLIAKGITQESLNKLYELNDGSYLLRENISDDLKTEFKKNINRLSSLFIIDAGEGMTQKIIREHWMTIGTENKVFEVFTKSGRVKAGAKGIGRFALDKLGNRCEMITVFDPQNHEKDIDEKGNITSFDGYVWKVNWEDFEGEFKTIDRVKAELTGFNSNSLKDEIRKVAPQIDLEKVTAEEKFRYGTILKITELRENWEDYFVDQVYSDLEVLVPPKEDSDFEIYLFSSLFFEKYGEVLGSICDDFDYKLFAVADENQNVKITVYRREYDVELIPRDFFKRNAMRKSPYTFSEFRKGIWETKTTFSQLMPGYSAIDKDNAFKSIGVFDFAFYFLKRTFNTPDANRFFYRRFLSNNRKDWLENFGGIKLFRDNFRVRPYGEVGEVAFDWLGLGNRKAASPAGVAKESGGYRVEPENVAGAIKISRLTNVDFEDKSSREGLQENKTFQVFKTLITSIINIFEYDRAYIAREMALYDDVRFGPEREKNKADALAREIIADRRAKSPDSTANAENYDKEAQEKEILAFAVEQKGEEIEKLKEEQKVLRGLASSGIVLASFSHDLSKLNNVLGSRIDKLKNLFSEKILESEYEKVEERKNPYAQLENMRKQDLKLQNWLNFSLGAARKDKRKRKQLFLRKYFREFKTDWESVLTGRGINLDVSKIADLDLRVFEIDIDSIFNNFLVNSIDAFNISMVNRSRRIAISVTHTSKEIVIDYHDNGPGLSKDIEKPEIIFEPLFTSKRNAFTGEEEGTGLGLWIVKSIVEENDGTAKLLFPSVGFGIRTTFPIKYKGA
jgi:signal transduction histidine kinase